MCVFSRLKIQLYKFRSFKEKKTLIGGHFENAHHTEKNFRRALYMVHLDENKNKMSLD